MITSQEELLQQLNESKLLEHRHNNLELKSDWAKDFGSKLSGCGNKLDVEACWLVIGVDDAGSLTGKDEKWAKNTEQIISQHVNAYLDPIQTCQMLTCVENSGGWIIIVKVKNPGAVTYWDKVAYKASGTTVVKMTPEETMEITIKLPGLTDCSRQPWTGMINKDLAKSFIEQVANNKDEIKRQDISNIDGIFEYMRIKNRNVCRILFGDCKYRVVFYDKENEPVNNEQRYGLYGLLDSAFLDEIQEWTTRMQSCAEASGIPRKALKEGLSNAVAHAAFFEKDGDVIVEVFCDKIVISNLCVPECGHFANKWFSRSHKTINTVLMEALRWAHKVDELGRGKSIIFSDSIKNGKKMPYVGMENAGRYNRWRLTIFSGAEDTRYIKIREEIGQKYENEQKALIAYALVLWKDQKVAVIKDYIDDESRQSFAEVLSDVFGPIYYDEKEDKIIPRRWVRVFLEGHDSKTLSAQEEAHLYRWVSEFKIQHSRPITPKELRGYADMGNSNSASVQSIALLQKWEKEGKVKKIKKGSYQFIKNEKAPSLTELMKILSAKGKNNFPGA